MPWFLFILLATCNHYLHYRLISWIPFQLIVWSMKCQKTVKNAHKFPEPSRQLKIAYFVQTIVKTPKMFNLLKQESFRGYNWSWVKFTSELIWYLCLPTQIRCCDLQPVSLSAGHLTPFVSRRKHMLYPSCYAVTAVLANCNICPLIVCKSRTVGFGRTNLTLSHWLHPYNHDI